jgi:translation initiation factor IF-3
MNQVFPFLMNTPYGSPDVEPDIAESAEFTAPTEYTVTLKEVKYRPKIDDHDFDYKTNHVREFLQEGNKVKITIMFRGREMAHPEFGQEILARVIEAIKDISQDHPDPTRTRLEGRNMSVVLTPAK